MNQETLTRQREAFEEHFAPLRELLADPTVKDIMLNAAEQPDECGEVWVDIEGVGLKQTDVRISPTDAIWMIRTVASDADPGEVTELNAANPVLSCRAAQGQFRFEAVIPPNVKTPTFTIRKYIRKNVTLAEYVGTAYNPGVLNADEAETLKTLVRARKTVLVVGETGCGKTTFLNALLAFVGTRRMILIEDTPELERPNGPSTKIHAHKHLSYQEAIVSALRQRPDGIVLGEIRHPDDATQALRAWKTGHQGFGTMHAGSCAGALWELFDLTRQSETGRHTHPRQVASAVNAVVHLCRSSGRRTADVQLVSGWSEAKQEFLLSPVA